MLYHPLSIIEKIIFTIVLLGGLSLFVYGAVSRFKLILEAQPDNVKDKVGERIKSFVLNVLLQKKLFKQPLRGLMHLFIFYGFIVYSITTINQMIEGFVDGFHIPVLLDPNWPAVANTYAFLLDLFTLLVIVGLIYFAWRRYITRAPNLDRPSTPSAIVISMIAILMISGMVMEASSYLISLSYGLDLAAYSPIREYFAQFMLSMDKAELVATQKTAWWVHLAAVLSFAVYVPNSKHAHLIYAPFNFYFIDTKARGEMSYIDLEAEDAVWGVSNVNEYTWTSLLDGLACIECGRCTDQCPAFATGKPLNPKEVIIEIKHATMEHMPAIAKAKKEGQEELPEALVAPQYVGVDTMWACTSCNACVEACPVGNDPMTKLLDLRRSKILMEGDLPNELALTLTNMENQSNPWGINAEKRADWSQGLDIPTLADNANVDYLFWVGCAGSFDDRAKKVSVALTKILKHAGISFGILGTEEQCSGDSARRGGNEYLYQMLAQGNVDTMNGYGVKKIITTCPHCFNTLKNEYPQFGGNYEIYHHTQFLADLMSSGKLPADSEATKEKIAYHDSCYMGRYNKEYDAPRSVIKNVGKVVADPPRSHSKSFCCGAGGAQMWMEESEPRVNDNRTQELLEQNTNTIATNCPFCMTMIEDGVKNKEKEDDVKVKDLAELVAQKLNL